MNYLSKLIGIPYYIMTLIGIYFAGMTVVDYLSKQEIFSMIALSIISGFILFLWLVNPLLVSKFKNSYEAKLQYVSIYVVSLFTALAVYFVIHPMVENGDLGAINILAENKYLFTSKAVFLAITGIHYYRFMELLKTIVSQRRKEK